MSTPSRRAEIRRRRTRTEKINKLRKHYSAAKNDADRKKVTDKLQKVSISISLDQFVKPIEARKTR